MARKVIRKVNQLRTSFQFKIGDQVEFKDWPEIKGKIVETDNNPDMKPYTVRNIKTGKEVYAWESEIKKISK